MSSGVRLGYVVRLKHLILEDRLLELSEVNWKGLKQRRTIEM